MAESGQLAAMCEDRGVRFTGSGSAASRLAFDKMAAKAAMAKAGIVTPPTLTMESVAMDLATYGRLVAKPVAGGSSFGLIFVEEPDDLGALRDAAQREAYPIEPFIAGVEATCGVLERDGEVIALPLPPGEISPADGVFDYTAKYLAPTTCEICPAGFNKEVNIALQSAALKAHSAVGVRGYSRSDFIVAGDRVIFLKINTLPGLTRASLFPKELAAQGIAFDKFLHGQIELAELGGR
jgi:D-alanine-D-alanine ligase